MWAKPPGVEEYEALLKPLNYAMLDRNLEIRRMLGIRDDHHLVGAVDSGWLPSRLGGHENSTISYSVGTCWALSRSCSRR